MLLLADSHLQRDQGHPSSSWTKSVPHDVTGLPVHSIKSCASSNFLRHKKLSHPSSGFPSACKEDYLIMSQRVCTQLTVGKLYSSSLSCSLLSKWRAETHRCPAAHLLSFFIFQPSGLQGSAVGAGQPTQLPHEYGSISFLPFPRSWWRPAQQPHLKMQERQYFQGQKNSITQAEKSLG